MATAMIAGISIQITIYLSSSSANENGSMNDCFHVSKWTVHSIIGVNKRVSVRCRRRSVSLPNPGWENQVTPVPRPDPAHSWSDCSSQLGQQKTTWPDPPHTSLGDLSNNIFTNFNTKSSMTNWFFVKKTRILVVIWICDSYVLSIFGGKVTEICHGW